jgi:hypothetical protein
MVVSALDSSNAPSGVSEVCTQVKSFKSTEMQQLVAFGVPPIFWALWKGRNRACFQNIFHVDPNVVIFSISQMLSFWLKLQRKKIRGRQVVGAKVLGIGGFPLEQRLGSGDQKIGVNKNL